MRRKNNSIPLKDTKFYTSKSKLKLPKILSDIFSVMCDRTQAMEPKQM